MSQRTRLRGQSRKDVDVAASNFKLCRYCGSSYSLYKNAWKKHERTCSQGPRAQASHSIPAPVEQQATVEARRVPHVASDDDSSSDFDDSSEDELLHDNYNDWEVPGYGQQTTGAVGTALEPDLNDDLDHASGSEDPNAIPPLSEGDVWIKRHPASGQPSGLLTAAPNPAREENAMDRAPSRFPPYFPFRTLDDFIQAEVFCDFGAVNEQIDRQLPLSNSTMKDAKEFHETLARATRIEGGEFITRPVVTHYEGHQYTHYTHFQPVFSWISRTVADPDLFQHMKLHPEQPWVYRPGTDGGAMRVWEELPHGDPWWELQGQIRPDQCVLYLVIYIDETNVSKIGGVKVWPIYMWVGNLPAAIRKRRGKKGGGTLIGYLPKARKDPKIKDLAGFRCKVYHDALQVIFETLRIPAKYGVSIRCGDGIMRNFLPILGAGAADYMELIRMICILGAKSGCPCPICLVDRMDQHKLTKQWPARTVSATEDIFRRAGYATTLEERDQILHEQSLRGIRSAFFDLIPPIHSIYNAIIADPLHQIEQGIWGKHLWPWIKAELPKASKQILDERFKSIPRFSDLKHFPNGITDLEYITGKEHGVILRVISPLIEDLLNEKYRKLILGTFRSLAIIHMLAKFTTHNDMTLAALEEEIERFDRLHRKLCKKFPNLHGDYPKFHSLSHIVRILRSHSTTDNYHTGLGEALHPQSKKDYRRTNHQLDFEIQMLHMYQEREAIMRIRVRVDAAARNENNDANPDADDAWDGPRVRLGAPDRQKRQLATIFVDQYKARNPSAKEMGQHLRIFLYQDVGGFGNKTHFRDSDLPSLNGMLVSTFHLVSIGFNSLLDSQAGLDIARSTDSWRKSGPRYDYVLASHRGGLFVAQLLQLFTIRVHNKHHPAAYVRVFKIGSRNKNTGYIRLSDTGKHKFIPIDSIIRACVVISAGTVDSERVLWDLEGPDIYLRLQEL